MDLFHYFLGIKFIQTTTDMSLTIPYALDVLQKFDLQNYNSNLTPIPTRTHLQDNLTLESVICLTHTRVGISLAVSQSSFQVHAGSKGLSLTSYYAHSLLC